MTAVLVAVHCSPPSVWFGGSTALIFVGVPAIRTLEGEPRGRAMKELGLRWRPLGYGALLVAALTGVALAARDWEHERGVPDRLLGEGRRSPSASSSSRTCTTSCSARACRKRSARAASRRRGPTLVVVGWLSYGLTLALPVLGVALAAARPSGVDWCPAH